MAEHRLTGRGPGRPKGSPNKTTTAVKAALTSAFDRIGGAKTFAAWAEANQTEFYKLWAKMLPQEVSGLDGAPITIERIEREIIDLAVTDADTEGAHTTH